MFFEAVDQRTDAIGTAMAYFDDPDGRHREIMAPMVRRTHPA